MDAVGARGFGEVAYDQQHCVGAFGEGHACIAAQVRAKTTKNRRKKKGTLTLRVTSAQEV